MIEINIPGYGNFAPEVLVLDFNGTIAVDGILFADTKEQLQKLSQMLEIHIITADTYGTVAAQCKELPVTLTTLTSSNHTKEKADYLKQFSARTIVAIGNGANDELLLKAADLGIAVAGVEGCAIKTLLNADIIVQNIQDALCLLLRPQRIIATLRD